LPALKCLLAVSAIDPEHPKCHEQGCRLRLALEKLDEPLPEKARQVVDSEFLRKTASKGSVEEEIGEYLAKHKDSALHVQGVVRGRHALHPDGSGDVKEKSAKDLQHTLDSEGTTLVQAEEGLRVLSEIVGADGKAREAYVAKARERWPEATVFQ